ncbi:hypothetical protein ABH929_002587 [Curtobacterium sp. AB7]
MPSRSASRPRRSAPARCPNSPARRFRLRLRLRLRLRVRLRVRLRLRERAKHPGASRRGPGVSPARALRTGRDQSGGAAPARLTATGPPGGHRHHPACVRLIPRPARSPSGRNTRVTPPPGRGIPPARAGAGRPERGSPRPSRRAGEMPGSPRPATAAFRPLAWWAQWTRPAWRPGTRPADRHRASVPSPPPPNAPPAPPPASGRNTRVLRDATRAFRPLAGSGDATAHQRGREPRTGRAPPAHGAHAGRE